MPMLAIPAFVALVLGFLALRTFLSEGRPLLVAFLSMCAVHPLLVALVGGSGIQWLHPILPVSATMIPPLAWITFQDALVSRLNLRALGLHAAAPAFTLFCRIFAPQTTDVVVPLIFLGYGAAILIVLRASTDMPLARLEAGRVPVLIWQILGWALIASALSDVLIALAYMTGNAGWAGWLITLSFSMALLLLGLLSGTPAASGPEMEEIEREPVLAPQDAIEDTEIVSRLAAFLAREPVHLDPNLTLSRLARRLHLSEKRLSAAVNRATGTNVSRYTNTWRIRHACKRIEAGSSITEAMLDSGFNTKSNFNREFSRITGSAPRQWQQGLENASPGARRSDVKEPQGFD
jgi:AraC-like DNA-binding protein